MVMGTREDKARENERRRMFPIQPPRWIQALFIAVIVGWFVYVLRDVLTPVVLALFIAYVLDPVVDRFERLKIPRALGILFVLLIAFSALALFLVITVPGIAKDISQFADELPEKTSAFLTKLSDALAPLGINMPESIGEAARQLTANQGTAQNVAGTAAGPVGAVLRWVVGGTASAVGQIVGALIVPVLAFYFLYDFDRMVAGIRDLVPLPKRPFVVDVAREIDQVLSSFIRGQLTVMLILAVLYSVAYSIAGIKLAIVIGIIGGLISFIPYVGSAVALGLALLMCAFDFEGWVQVGMVVGAYSLIQTLEGFVITPKVVGDQVGLSAVWVLLALMVGAELFGLLGVLLALPAAAILKIFVMRALAAYRESAFFMGRSPQSVGRVLGQEGLPDSPELSRKKEEARRTGERELVSVSDSDSESDLEVEDETGRESK